MSDPGSQAIAEVVRLHVAIEGWVTGALAEDRFETDFARHLHPAFRIVEPSGALVPRTQIVDALRGGRGKNPAFRITIDAPEIVLDRGDEVLITYIERQTGARQATDTNARRSTALLAMGPLITWRFLHETWITP